MFTTEEEVIETVVKKIASGEVTLQTGNSRNVSVWGNKLVGSMKVKGGTGCASKQYEGQNWGGGGISRIGIRELWGGSKQGQGGLLVNHWGLGMGRGSKGGGKRGSIMQRQNSGLFFK